MEKECIFVRSEWRGSRLEATGLCADVGRALCDVEARSILGESWFHTAGSRAAALRRPVTLEEVSSPDAWRRSRRLADEPILALHLWNGLDDFASRGLSASLHLFDGPTHQVVISGFWWDPTSGVGSGTLEAARQLGRHLAASLSGYSCVSSSPRIDELREAGFGSAIDMGYGHFWGPEPAGANPAFDVVRERRLPLPWEILCGTPGKHPDANELAQLRELNTLLRRTSTPGP